MSELLEIQRAIAASLRDAGADSQSTQWIAGDAAMARQRLSVYRANLAASVSKVLSAAYPVILQIVGHGSFQALAQAYGETYSSTSGDLFEYGANLAAFVSRFEHTRKIPYLPDLARLEWAVHRAYGAEDAPAWDATTLASVAPEQQTSVRFDWPSGSALISSEFPIVRIWTIHQASHEGAFDLDGTGAECAWVTRRGRSVEVCRLSASEAAFIGSMLRGSTLGDASSTALDVNANFDLGALLARLIASNLIAGFSIVAAGDSTENRPKK